MGAHSAPSKTAGAFWTFLGIVLGGGALVVSIVGIGWWLEKVTTPQPPAGRYVADVVERIDVYASRGDCDALQEEFDAAEALDAAERDRTGEGTADLLAYIDDRMRKAGCYG